MKALLIREMLPSERGLVLSDWKKDLWDDRPDWGRALHSDEWWALMNHVLDTITLPSSTVWMACHRDEEIVPLCWLAERGGVVLHMHASASARKDTELAARLERSLTEHACAIPGAFNPFIELKQARRTA